MDVTKPMSMGVEELLAESQARVDRGDMRTVEAQTGLRELCVEVREVGGGLASPLPCVHVFKDQRRTEDAVERRVFDHVRVDHNRIRVSCQSLERLNQLDLWQVAVL